MSSKKGGYLNTRRGNNLNLFETSSPSGRTPSKKPPGIRTSHFGPDGPSTKTPAVGNKKISRSITELSSTESTPMAHEQKPQDARKSITPLPPFILPQVGPNDTMSSLTHNSELVDVYVAPPLEESQMQFTWRTNDSDIYDPDSGSAVQEKDHNGTGAYTYQRTCVKLGIPVLLHVYVQLGKPNVNLKYYHLSAAHACALAESIRHSTCLRVLSLKGCSLTAQGVLSLCHVLTSNTTLQEFSLAENTLGLLAALPLARMLGGKCTVTRLDLSSNVLPDKFMEAMKESLANNNRLTYLDLSKNALSGQHFGEILARNNSLRHVDLSWNAFRRQGITDLSAGLASNYSVRKLNLSFNSLSAIAAGSVFRAMQENVMVEHLDLSNCTLTDECRGPLIAALRENQKLSNLILCGNHLSEATYDLILRVANEEFMFLNGLTVAPRSERPAYEEVVVTKKKKGKKAAATPAP